MGTSIKLILILIFLLGAAAASVGWYFYYRKKTGWIAVADALPMDDTHIIVVFSHGDKRYTSYVYHYQGTYISISGTEIRNVEKWQPLPEPPK